ncbi:8-amino-7-oxononanoate synthase [Solemya elarraichensis gill symbiont]|uniref:8-amino-7-oxononanoate synthase n=1 Tax=Solemya elarraichensis gill symbiont TaxID=1918949 RepID=A0A1T2L8N0_9GAMM|nr:8-amino-7-oxononanoate synthase [Solemya elarraichensis gill symbiont]OOZ41445.1 8-amino-7-oxononanoate synthase [Solemya elarraichensis gill symbiont]
MRDYSARLLQRKEDGLYRHRRIIESPQSTEIVCDGKKLLSFCSNDYLGLANDARIKQAFIRGIACWGNGAGAAHLITGHTSAHHHLEEELAEWLGRESALLFSTGYMANSGIINALMGRGDVVVEDRLNHASLIDGGLNSGAQLLRYPHVDAHTAEQQLSDHKEKHALLATDGVFSMDGDIAPLRELANASRKHDALLLVDDAHGIGTLGHQGRGSLDREALSQQDVPLLMGTLGKGFGVFGAFVAGPELLIESIIQDARSYLFTTAAPAAIAEANRAALRCVIEDQWRRDKLAVLITRFRSGAEQLGLQLMPSETPIQPVLVGEADKALTMSRALEEQGVLVTAIRPPTVPRNSSRLRVTLSANHEETDVDKLLVAFEKVQAGETA